MYDIWYSYMVVCSYITYVIRDPFLGMIRLVPCIINVVDAVCGNISIKIKIQQGKQCTYSVALWRVRVTIVVINTQHCSYC